MDPRETPAASTRTPARAISVCEPGSSTARRSSPCPAPAIALGWHRASSALVRAAPCSARRWSRSAATGPWAGLRRSALPPIQHVKARQAPEVVAGPQDDARARRARLLSQRHVLEVGLIRGCPSLAEIWVQRFVARPGVVVVDLVIVPGHQPRHSGVQPLEVLGGLVLSVPVSVVRERPGLASDMTPYVAGAARPFVDVVADEHHQVQVLRGQVPMRAVEAVLEVLA